MTYLDPTRRRERYSVTATYWAQKRQDGYGGESWVTPVQIQCRWEDFVEEQLSVAYRAEGETATSNAHVWSMVPLIEGGYLFKGISTDSNPSRLRVGHLKAFIIRKVALTPSLRGDYTEYTAFL